MPHITRCGLVCLFLMVSASFVLPATAQTDTIATDSLQVAILEVEEEQAPSDPGNLGMNELLRLVRNADLMRGRIRPREASVFSGDSLPDDFRMNPLFMPMAFRSDLNRTLIPPVSLQPKEYLYSKAFWKRLGERPFDSREFSGQLYVSQMNHRVMRELQIERIDLVKYGLDQLPEHEKIVKKPVSIQPIRAVSDREVRISNPTRDVRQAIEGYSYWNFRGRLSNQITQTYVSPNWSSGGNSNMAGLFSIYWTGKYNDKKKIQFDNIIDLKIGVNTASNDTLRHYSVSTDQLHIQSKLGVRAVKNWYYSASADIQTQLLNSYKANTMNLKSSLLSPATLFLSLGMDYKISKKNKSLSVLITPLTYRMNYLLDIENFKPKSYGIEEGHHFGHEFGVKLSSTYDWKITDDISWNSYIYYYSDFSYVDSEWKNTFNLTINEYLSTQLFVHLKFDDRTRNAEYPSHFQLKEYLSLGLTYYW